MKRMLAMAVTAAVSLGAATAQAEDVTALKAEAVQVMKTFGGALKQELVGAMKAGGPVEAIAACNQAAPSIAADASTGGWSVGRTSLRLRNPDNAPDPWERRVLDNFESRKRAGEDVADLATAVIAERPDGTKVFRFMKAIPTQEVCLNCHGSDLKPEVAARLDRLYPQDAARGFAVGDIRGAFTLEKRL